MEGEQSARPSWTRHLTHCPRYCVPRRCRLCRFTITAGETIVAGIDDSRLSTPFVYNGGKVHLDAKLLAEFKCCFPICDHLAKRSKSVAYHAECLNLTSSLPSAAFLHATEYAFEPMPWQDRQRHARIKHLLARRLGIVCPALAAELRFMIARHLVRLGAVMATEALWEARRSHDSHVDVSKDIWASYVHIEGIRYLASLSNDRDGAGPGSGSYRLVAAGRASPQSTLYVLQDHLGVRQLVLTPPGNPVKLPSFDSSKPGPWWRMWAECSKTLEAKSDGLKLRSISPSTPPTEQSKTMLWSVPLQPSELGSFSFPNAGRHLKQLQMLPFPLNDPRVTGYSFCWSFRLLRLLRLHAHRDGEDMTFYRDLDSIDELPAWVYIPNDPGELVTDVWFRLYDARHRDLALLFRTSRDRITHVGRLLMRPDSATPWSRLCGLLQGPTTMYLNHSDWGVSLLSMPGPNNPDPVCIPVVPTQNYRGRTPWLYNKASLTGVVEIVPCRWRRPTTHSEDDPCPPLVGGIQIAEDYFPITGLLFRYADGSRACVGEFRLDQAGDALLVEDGERLYLGFKSVLLEYPYIAEVRLSAAAPVTSSQPPSDGSPLEWLDVGWEGELEWVFSRHGCHVIHGNRASPPVVSLEEMKAQVAKLKAEFR